MPPTIEERHEALERIVAFMLDALAETVNTTHLRLLALQQVLEQKGVLTGPDDPDVKARMQAISEAAELELEYGDDPEKKRFRELRRMLESKPAPPPEEEEGGDDGPTG